MTDQIPPETQEKRNKLWPQFIQAKREKKSAKFIDDKLLIDNKIILPSEDRNRNITRDITDEAIQINTVDHSILSLKAPPNEHNHKFFT